MHQHGKEIKNAPMARFLLLFIYYITHANVALAFFNINQPIR